MCIRDRTWTVSLLKENRHRKIPCTDWEIRFKKIISMRKGRISIRPILRCEESYDCSLTSFLPELLWIVISVTIEALLSVRATWQIKISETSEKDIWREHLKRTVPSNIKCIFQSFRTSVVTEAKRAAIYVGQNWFLQLLQKCKVASDQYFIWKRREDMYKSYSTELAGRRCV